MTGLQSFTTYEVQVKEFCSATDSSIWFGIYHVHYGDCAQLDGELPRRIPSDRVDSCSRPFSLTHRVYVNDLFFMGTR